MSDVDEGLDASGSGWIADPSGAHQHRYILRGEPSSLVRDGEVEGIDAYVGPRLDLLPPAPPPPPPPATLREALGPLPMMAPPAPPAPPRAPARPAPRRGRGGRGVAVLAVVALVAGGWVVRDRVLPADGAVAAAGPEHPEAWDPRVVPHVEFVEAERQLFFRHPVAVEFLPDAEFVAAVRAAEAADTAAADERADRLDEAYRALGITHGDVDLDAAGEALVDNGILGFYSWDDQRIRVRGGELTAEVAAVLVHELVHALQDQHFDLDALDAGAATSGQALGVEGLVEGDATAVEVAWRTQHPSDDPAGDDDLELGALTGTVGLDFLAQAPYLFGYALVATLSANGGAAAVDRAFASPPASDAQLIFPDAFRAGVRPVTVPVPALGDGEVEVQLVDADHPQAGSSDVGALFWYVAVAGRLDHHAAWDVARGWAGDASVTFRAGDRTCVRSSVAADGPERLARLGDVFQAWVDAVPAAGGTVVRADDVVTVTTCDPGPEGSTAPDGLSASLEALRYVNLAVLAGADSDAEPALRSCMADELMATMPADEVVRLTTGEGDEAATARIAEVCAAAD